MGEEMNMIQIIELIQSVYFGTCYMREIFAFLNPNYRFCLETWSVIESCYMKGLDDMCDWHHQITKQNVRGQTWRNWVNFGWNLTRMFWLLPFRHFLLKTENKKLNDQISTGFRTVWTDLWFRLDVEFYISLWTCLKLMPWSPPLCKAASYEPRIAHLGIWSDT